MHSTLSARPGKSALALATLAITAAASPAFAGFVATTGPDDATRTKTTSANVSSGDTFTVTQGTLSSYVPTGSSDPQLQGGDIDRYGFEFEFVIDTVTGNTATLTDTIYRLFYDINNDEDYDAGTDTSISFGEGQNLSVTFTSTTGTFDGELFQTEGPTGPGSENFADLGATYGGNPVDITGEYLGDDANSGTLTTTLTQSAVAIPAPGAAMGGMALCGLVGLKRRRMMA